MIVKKGGISRNIDDKRLHEYKAKGYVPAGGSGNEEPNAGKEKAIEKMNTEELTKKAAELGVDISDATTNKQRADAILAHIAAAGGSGNEEE